MSKKILPQNQPTKPAYVSIVAAPSVSIDYSTSTQTNTALDYSANYSAMLKDTLDRLLYSRFEFYLCGSRAMNKRDPMLIRIGANTDYDFYATYNDDICEYLEDIGFMYIHNNDDNYLDDEAVCLMRWTKSNIDIVLRKDAKFYREVFESISPEMYQKYLWKQNPDVDRSKIKSIFNAMFTIARNKKLVQK